MELPSRRLWQGSLCPYPIFFGTSKKTLYKQACLCYNNSAFTSTRRWLNG